jgi:putative oxidoreductase
MKVSGIGDGNRFKEANFTQARTHTMQALIQRLTGMAPRVLGIVRIVAALTFMAHGTQKLFNFPASEDGAVAWMSIFGIAGMLESVGGILLLLGLFTRPVAFILSGEMAVAYRTYHVPSSFYPANNGGDAAILYCFVFLYLAFAGPGAFAIQREK